MIQLFGFQQTAADTMADRFVEYYNDPVVTGTKRNQRQIPFFQSLDSLTASGKTVILADAISTICQSLPIPPVVLWLSKGKVVVEQGYGNLLPGGKYHHLLGDSVVETLAEYNATEVKESDRPLMYFATVGTFNRKDKEEGNLLIYRSEIDTAEQSTWDALKLRESPDGERRPLIVVYDEAHNLSDQQTDLLLELEPDAFLLATATMRLPPRLSAEVDELKRNGRDDDWLVTSVDAKAVADADLVKSTLLLAGYRAPMEETVSALLADMADATAQAPEQGLDGLPKAIYVCQTNIVQGDAFRRDDPKRAFTEREAPPILIWRHLTENCGVDPATIAVYSTLAFHKEHPPPTEFIHFKGGDKDFQAFTEGNYRHIIFNLSLQEGWDDPLCYFAYIDKSMESRVQVEQVIGRVLRQPGTRRYGAERLNTAHFYVRVDRNEVFNELLGDVSKKLASDAPEIRLISSAPGKQKPVAIPAKGHYEIPETALSSKRAQEAVGKILDGLTDYRADNGTNIQSAGERGTVTHVIGGNGASAGAVAWETFNLAGKVSARWIFTREVKRRFAGALEVADITQPKFDAKVGIGSNAFGHIVQAAETVVNTYIDEVFLKQKRLDPFVVGDTLVRRDEMTPFANAVHEGYDGLNKFEGPFAEKLDAVGAPWFRNPPRSGYGIPLISAGPTSNFYPDFIVWRDDVVFAIDTKGGHLLAEAASRKLLRIEPPAGATTRLLVRFVSEGRWTPETQQTGKDGYTVWGLKQDGTRRATHVADLDAVIEKVLDPDPT